MAHKQSHVRHDVLGYIPRPGHRQPGLAVGSNGLRSSGPAPDQAVSAPPILAVGDSFTFGQDVDDHETWPAQLQRLTGRRVLNGGVSGYGFDQIVLRAEELTSIYRPSTVIVSFIADDIYRNEMKQLWGYDKPWFALDDGRLSLRRPGPENRSFLPLPLRHQVERVFFELPLFLKHWVGYHRRVHPPGVGQVIACLLMERLAALAAASRTRIVVLAQYDRHVLTRLPTGRERWETTRAVLESAAANGLATLDSLGRLNAEPKTRSLFESWHMNARGNFLIASLLANTLPTLVGDGVSQ